jgi:hypothetical protein
MTQRLSVITQRLSVITQRLSHLCLDAGKAHAQILSLEHHHLLRTKRLVHADQDEFSPWLHQTISYVNFGLEKAYQFAL